MNIKKYLTPQQCAEIYGCTDRFWQQVAHKLQGTKRAGTRLLLPIDGVENFLKDVTGNEKN